MYRSVYMFRKLRTRHLAVPQKIYQQSSSGESDNYSVELSKMFSFTIPLNPITWTRAYAFLSREARVKSTHQQKGTSLSKWQKIYSLVRTPSLIVNQSIKLTVLKEIVNKWILSYFEIKLNRVSYLPFIHISKWLIA